MFLHKAFLYSKMIKLNRFYYSTLLQKIYSHVETTNKGSIAIIESLQNVLHDNNNNTNCKIDYKDLISQIDNFSTRLALSMDEHTEHKSDNVKKTKTTIAFLCRPSIKYVVTLLSIWRLGHIAVPLSPLHPTNEILHVIKDSKSEIVIVEAPLENLVQIDDKLIVQEQIYPTVINFEKIAMRNNDDVIRQILPSLMNNSNVNDNDDDAYIVYTSGTTGTPKGVVHTHAAIKTQVEDMVSEWKWNPNDHILHFLPLHHLHGIVNKLFCCLWVGGTVEFIEPSADILWSRIIQNNNNKYPQPTANLFMAVPTIFQKMLETYHTYPTEKQNEIQHACKSFRLMVSGSAALPINVLDEWRQATGHILLERYGMSEFCMGLTNPYEPIENRTPGFVGKNFPSIDIILCEYEEDDDETVEPESKINTDRPIALPSKGVSIPGEIRIKGSGMFSRYLNLDDVTKEAFDINGYFKTGDIAVFDSDINSYKILGRKSTDIIKHKGFKISALEIERYVLEHPNVLEACVFGVPDTVHGEGIYCLLRCINTCNWKITERHPEEEGKIIFESEMNIFLSQRLAKYKLPSQYKIVDDIPKNQMGKINKKIVMKQLGFE
jgi:malonyl-CoA/methylmalonyl-CoA synthetase